MEKHMRVFTHWDQELTEDESSDVLLNLALWELADVTDTAASDSLTDALVHGRLKEVIEYVVDYTRLSRADCCRIRQVQAFYAKRSDLDLGYDQHKTAVEKFRASEELCKATNEIFKLRASGKFQLLPRVERVLWHASRKIRSILGDIPKLSELQFRFGPGATTQIPKRTASARAKLGQDPACSSELFPWRHLVLQEMPSWHDALLPEGPHRPGAIPVVLHPGKIAFVPKSAKEFRTIMVEPSLNTMCQAGIGSFMAKRLRRCGVDIRNQKRNQSLARKGSIDGSLATVDLSSASDTVSTELVYDLLGLDWASWLARFRTGTAVFEGSPLQLEKFSSMGNGFTFPLETLIFYAIAWGTCVEEGTPCDDVSAYGDDIIIPVRSFALLSEVLNACGFLLNEKKSFAEGPFRESCGVDFYQGIDIRPIYQKDRLRVCDLFRIHNFYYRNFSEEVCAYIRSFLHPNLILLGPDGYGDGHLLGEWVPRRKKNHSSSGYDGYIFDTFTFKPRRSFFTSRGDRVLPFYSTYVQENASREELRASEARYDKGGCLSVAVPGYRGVNRISIYTLMRP